MVPRSQRSHLQLLSKLVAGELVTLFPELVLRQALGRKKRHPFVALITGPWLGPFQIMRPFVGGVVDHCRTGSLSCGSCLDPCPFSSRSGRYLVNPHLVTIPIIEVVGLHFSICVGVPEPPDHSDYLSLFLYLLRR